MKQLTLAAVGFERYPKTTRRAALLAEMERVVRWSATVAMKRGLTSPTLCTPPVTVTMSLRSTAFARVAAKPAFTHGTNLSFDCEAVHTRTAPWEVNVLSSKRKEHLGYEANRVGSACGWPR